MSYYIPFPNQYSATLIGSDGRVSRICRDFNYVRLELYPDGSYNSGNLLVITPEKISITRPDLKKVFSIRLKEKLILEMNLPKNFEKQDLSAELNWTKCEQVVLENIVCDKYELRHPGCEPVVEVIYINVDNNMRQLVNTYNKNGCLSLTIRWVDVIIGPPEKECFEIPKDMQIKKIN